MAIDILFLILNSIYYYLPAYFANGMPIIFGGGFPLDFYKNWKDGKRIFGDGKTFRGALIGITVGTLGMGVWQGNIKLAFFMSTGAILGDLIKSFIKRRLGYDKGERFFPWDQIDFLIGAIIFSSLIEAQHIDFVITILVITPLIHLTTNYGSYLLGLKKVPH